MRTSKAILNFTGLSDGNLESVALSIIDSMTDNANFPNPVPSLSEVTAAVTDFSSALSGAKSGDKAQIELKNIKKAAMIDLLKRLAAYVTFTANGNRNVIATSGFTISKDGSSSRAMTAPASFKMTVGKTPGQATSTVSGVKGVKAYAHQYTADPMTDASVWQSELVTSRSHTFTGLE